MSSWNKDEDEEEEEGDDEESELKTKQDRIIFLIDAREAMITPNATGEPILVNCLKLVLAVMKSKIISNDSSAMGLTFFGTKNRDTESTTDGIYTLFPLNIPSATYIRQLQALIDDIDEFHNKIGCQSDQQSCPLKQAFWSCSQSFDSLKSAGSGKSDFKRIWIFTNDDNPMGHSPADQAQIIRVGRDCAQNGIEASLWYINRKDRDFDPQKFYAKLMLADNEDDGDDEDALANRMLGAGEDGFDTSMASLRRRQFKKRQLTSTLFSIGGDSNSNEGHMAVRLYKVLSVTKKPLHTWLCAHTNEPLKVVTKYIAARTGAQLDETQICTYMEVGGVRVPMTKAQVAEAHTSISGTISKNQDAGDLTDPNPEGEEEPLTVGIKLLYFTAKTNLKVEQNVSEPYFIVPDEKSIKGSSVLFGSLLREMSSKDLIAIVEFRRTKTTTAPILAALQPQAEELDADGAQLIPPGMNLIPIPYCNDVRSNPNPIYRDMENPAYVIQMSDAVLAASNLIDALQFGEDSAYFEVIESPSLQNFYSVLQAVALTNEPEWSAHRDDNMQPSEEMKKHFEANVENIIAFKETIGLTDEAMLGVPTKKRAAGGEGGAAKKAKVTGEGGDLTVEDIKALVSSNSLMSCTADKLKEICRTLGLAVSGTKAVLTKRIDEKVASM